MQARDFRSLTVVGLALATSIGLAAPAVAAPALRAGAARVDVTPAGDPAYPASGRYAHERLYARAIVLDNGATRAALVGLDLGGIDEDIWAKASWASARRGSPRSRTRSS
jgi:hypothetical protein